MIDARLPNCNSSATASDVADMLEKFVELYS